MPELSARQNILVITDEAHRSQYGVGGKVNDKESNLGWGLGELKLWSTLAGPPLCLCDLAE